MAAERRKPGNIAAMAANPNDLIRGHGLPASDSKEPTLAINRIWTDKPKALLDPGGGQLQRRISGSGRAPARAAAPDPAALAVADLSAADPAREEARCLMTAATSFIWINGEAGDGSSARHDRPALTAFITDARSEEALRDGLTDCRQRRHSIFAAAAYVRRSRRCRNRPRRGCWSSTSAAKINR